MSSTATDADLPDGARRAGSCRERRGRQLRGPLCLPGPLTPRAALLRPTRRDEFDDLVVALVERLTSRLSGELDGVEFGTEDAPHIDDDWTEPVPASSLTPPDARTPARIVVFRRPIELHARSRAERIALVHEQLVEQVAALLGRDPAELDD